MQRREQKRKRRGKTTPAVGVTFASHFCPGSIPPKLSREPQTRRQGSPRLTGPEVLDSSKYKPPTGEGTIIPDLDEEKPLQIISQRQNGTKISKHKKIRHDEKN